MLTPPDALLVEGSATSAFERTPFFRNLPAVRAGHVAEAASYEELGPLGVGFLYSALEHAFGLVERHGPGAAVATFSPSTRRLCTAHAAGRATCRVVRP
jgi:hypothetical protein